MKKQKFNGKLRLKKNVISNLNASAVLGGNGNFSCMQNTDCCLPQTLIGQATCGPNCNVTVDPGCASGRPDCNTQLGYVTDCDCP